MLLSHRPVAEKDIQLICGFPQSDDELFFFFPKASFPLAASQLQDAIAQRSDSTVVELDGDKLVSIFDGKADFGPTLPKRPQPEHVQGSRKAQHVAEKQQKVWIDYLPVILLALIALTVLSVVFYMSWSNRTSKPMITQNESSISVNNQVSSVSSSTVKPW